MARARNIKPGFFKNEELVELPYETRLLFIGLWTVADREGRLEDRPKRIKMELFPADSIDIDECLNQLQASGFVLRYAIAGVRYIQVLAFSKHQNPHQKEAASTIPPPDSETNHDTEAPDKHDASPVQAPDKHDASPADSLNTDSLIPDSGNPLSSARAETGADAPEITSTTGGMAGVQAERFERWYRHWPKKKSRGAAEKAWKAIKPAPDDALVNLMIEKTTAWAASHEWTKENRQFCPNPATWLNAKGWLDDDPASTPANITPFQTSNRKQGSGWSSHDIAAYAVELERRGQ